MGARRGLKTHILYSLDWWSQSLPIPTGVRDWGNFAALGQVDHRKGLLHVLSSRGSNWSHPAWGFYDFPPSWWILGQMASSIGSIKSSLTYPIQCTGMAEF